MQIYDPTKLLTLDLSDSQLPDEEVAELLARIEREAQQERMAKQKRIEKRTSFRFIGGMC